MANNIIDHLRAFINYSERNCNQKSLNRELDNLERGLEFKDG